MNQQLIDAATTGNLPEVKRLVAAGANPAAQNNYAIIYASAYGHLNVVQYLVTLPKVDPTAQDNQAIIWAAEFGHLNVVQYLASLQGFDPQGDDYDLWIWAISKNLIDIVRDLVDQHVVYPALNNNHALIVAAQNG